MFIYKITNTVNSKIYIGLTTTTLSRRISCYKSESKSGRKSKQSIIAAFRKYGFENFIFEQIDFATSEKELKLKEIEYIKKFASINPKIGYNISLGGDLHSEQTRAKMSDSQKRKKLTETHKENISNGLMGHAVSESSKRKNSQSNLGRKAWNKGSKGTMKYNSTSFKKGSKAPNKGRKRVLDANGDIRYVLHA